MKEKEWIDNYWMKTYGSSRNQVRRIINGAPYCAALDGSPEEYKERKQKIGDNYE